MYLARQLFVPAFLTLLLLGVAAVCALPAPAPPAGPALLPGLAFALPETALLQLEATFPLITRIVMLLGVLRAGIAAGRISVRSNLYGVNTCLSIPLFGIFVCCLAGRSLTLPLLLAVLLLAGAVKRYCESMRDGYSFDALFRGSFLLGALALVRPAALPLLLILPFGTLLFQRTRRETVVALAGLLFAPLLLCYLNWSFGGTFAAPVTALWERFADGLPAALFRAGFAPWMGIAAAVLLLDLFGAGSVWANLYSVSARARMLLLFNIGTLLLGIGVLAGPAARPADGLLLAVPSAVLLPFFLVRIRATLASLLYLLLLAAAVLLLWLPFAWC